MAPEKQDYASFIHPSALRSRRALRSMPFCWKFLPWEAQQDTCTTFEEEEEADAEDEDEEEGKDVPRLRKSLQSGMLKLIHEIERLQANAAGEKTHPVHVLDSNSG